MYVITFATLWFINEYCQSLKKYTTELQITLLLYHLSNVILWRLFLGTLDGTFLLILTLSNLKRKTKTFVKTLFQHFTQTKGHWCVKLATNLSAFWLATIVALPYLFLSFMNRVRIHLRKVLLLGLLDRWRFISHAWGFLD